MSYPSATESLLPGLLAARLGFVSENDVAAALATWGRDQSRPLTTLLAEQGKLSHQQLALLDGLLQQVVEAQHQALVTGDVACSPEARVADPARARFRVLQSHAKGCLGEVFLALDTGLQRQVALKEIQLHHANDPDSHSRFVLEAEITGRLEHPGIVPVYDLGWHEDGRPFYAMRFIQGSSLAEAIALFHDQDKTAPLTARSLAFRQLLGRLMAVCQAIAFAHSRGVLHRNLKPANVMLGDFGETLVVDWSLARFLAQDHSDDLVTATVTWTGDAAGPTSPGTTVGTPAFMSPEQAAGQTIGLTVASDIYSLGAILYCLLTGQAPFKDDQAKDLLQRVQKGDFPGVRRVKPTVPKALEAICSKAMALVPTERYATARALADDLDHWLADEPVSAYREPLQTRARRWVRRHWTLVIGWLVVTAASL